MTPAVPAALETATAAENVLAVARRIQSRELQGAAAVQAASQLKLDLVSIDGAWSGTAGDALVVLLNSVGDSVASSALSGRRAREHCRRVVFRGRGRLDCDGRCVEC